MDHMVLWAIEQERRAEVHWLRRSRLAASTGERAPASIDAPVARPRRAPSVMQRLAAIPRRLLRTRRPAAHLWKEYGDVFTRFE